jgi:hypothetical protein
LWRKRGAPSNEAPLSHAAAATTGNEFAPCLCRGHEAAAPEATKPSTAAPSRRIAGTPTHARHLVARAMEKLAFCKDFDDTMAKFNVPEAEHKELFAIVESTKDDIVSAPSSL